MTSLHTPGKTSERLSAFQTRVASVRTNPELAHTKKEQLVTARGGLQITTSFDGNKSDGGGNG